MRWRLATECHLPDLVILSDDICKENFCCEVERDGKITHEVKHANECPVEKRSSIDSLLDTCDASRIELIKRYREQLSTTTLFETTARTVDQSFVSSD